MSTIRAQESALNRWKKTDDDDRKKNTANALTASAIAAERKAYTVALIDEITRRANGGR